MCCRCACFLVSSLYGQVHVNRVARAILGLCNDPCRLAAAHATVERERAPVETRDTWGHDRVASRVAGAAQSKHEPAIQQLGSSCWGGLQLARSFQEGVTEGHADSPR